MDPAAVRLAGQTSGHYVFSTDVVEKSFWVFRTTRHPVRVVNRGGFINFLCHRQAAYKLSIDLAIA